MILKANDRDEILRAVKAAFRKIYGTQKQYESNDVIITATQLTEKFPAFTKEWIRRHGYLLPRVRVEKWEDDTCTDKWGYRWHEIQKEIHEGKYRNLKLFQYTR